MLIFLTANLISQDIHNNKLFFYILKNNAITYTTFPKIYILYIIYMFLLTAYYVIFYMCLLFTLWRMNKYQSIKRLKQGKK